MQSFHNYTKKIKVKGNEIDVRIEYAWDYDNSTDPEGSFDFGTEQENAEYLKKFQDGDLITADIKVRATFQGLEGIDYLGACHIEPGNTDQMIDLINDHGMEKNAIDELIIAIEVFLEKFQEQSDKNFAAEYGIIIDKKKGV